MGSKLPTLSDRVFLLDELRAIEHTFPRGTEGTVSEYHGEERRHVVVALPHGIKVLTPVEAFWTMWHDDTTFWSRLVMEEDG